MNEEALFGEALSRLPEERAAFLDQACAGRPDLRRAVESLLAAYEKPGNILDRPRLELESTDDSENVQVDQGLNPGTEAGPRSSDHTIDHGHTPAATDPSISDQGQNGHLARGTTVRYFGDYEIQKELGRGGMGVVYKAKQLSLNRSVALKMIKAGLLADDAELRRFQNEAEAVASLDHPGIVPVYEVGDHEGQRYFSMKLVEGGNLADKLAAFKDNPNAAVALVIETADAVLHAHMRGILHRDLKPANILIDEAGHPHVTDFGLAKHIEGDVELTATGAVLGTPAYMSPEQANGRPGSITTATDVYGLGAILYALLAGKAPFGGDSLIETLDAVRTRPPVALRKLNAKVPRDLELICLKCLEKNPIERYPTAGALADDLRHFAAGEPVSVRASGVVERVAKWARRKPTLAAAYTLGFLTLVFGGLGGTAGWQWRAAERARDVAEVRRLDAVKSRGQAEVARGKAVDAQADADRQREKIEGIEYGRTLEVARQEWVDLNVASARELLEGTRPDLRGWEWNYLDRLCHADRFTVSGIAIGYWMKEASFSPDGSRIVTSHNDSTAKVWDVETGALLLTLKGHSNVVFSGTFSPDGSRIVTSSDDGTAKVWDATTGEMFCTVPAQRLPGNIFPFASFSPDGTRIVASHNYHPAGVFEPARVDEAKVWDARTGALLLTLKDSIRAVVSGAYSPDGTRIVTRQSGAGATDRDTVKIWDAKTGSPIHTWAAQRFPFKFESASFSPDGTRVLLYGRGDGIKIMDAKGGKEILAIEKTDGSGSKDIVSFSPDGSRLLRTKEGSNEVMVWDATTGREVTSIRGHAGTVWYAAFSPDSSHIVTASDDKSVRLWDARTGAELLTLRGHNDVVHFATFSPDGSRLVTTSSDGTAKLWDVPRTDSQTWFVNTNQLGSAAFSPEGSVIATAARIGKIWNPGTGAEIRSLASNRNNVLNSVAFCPGGCHLISGLGFNPEHDVCIWDRDTGMMVGILHSHKSQVKSACYSNDGTRIVTASNGQNSIGDKVVPNTSEVKVWDGRTGKELFTITDAGSRFQSAAFNPAGTRIVTAGSSAAKVWDAKTGAELLALNGHDGEVRSAAFSPDGTRIVTAGGDKTAKVWDAASGILVFTLKGHTLGLNTASFSPDGSRIVTSSADRTAKVWDARTGTNVLTLRGSFDVVHSDWDSPEGVYSASFSPDGTRIVIAIKDGDVRVWDSTPINREILARRPGPPPLPRSATLASRLPAVLRGDDQPADFAECVSFSELATNERKFATAARLFAVMLGNNPKLGDDHKGLRFKAAQVSVRAANGESRGEHPPDEATKVTLRRRARAWLRDDLTMWADFLKNGGPYPREFLVARLFAWKQSPILAGIRDPVALAKLSEVERKEFETFWADVDEVLNSEERVSALTADDPETLASLRARARALAQSRPVEAEGLLRRVIESCSRTIAERNPFLMSKWGVDATAELAELLEQTGRDAEAEAEFRAAIAGTGKAGSYGPTHLSTREILAKFGDHLLRRSKWTDAEAVVRELLAIPEKVKSEEWITFYARSQLGASLLGQRNFDEAEPLIVSGFEGLKARAVNLPPSSGHLLDRAAKRVIQLYETWGKPDKAAEWRIKLGRPELPKNVFAK